MNRFLYNVCLIVVVATAIVLSTDGAFAQERQVLSVTPPLFQLSSAPGDMWQSSVKVVNGNAYPLTIYAEVVNFKAVGEAGQGRFVTVEESGGGGSTLAEWVHMNQESVTIPPEQTAELSFYVEIPEDAAPGGHYAAILVTTNQPTGEGAVMLNTAQTVTSLFFVRIEGDVHEEGTIREFRAVDSFIDVPDATFSLRFENKGNVHLQPKGDIVITNMWGTVRGTIPVNYRSHYGNVLPESIRDFEFAWKSNFKISDIGRYKAIATLAYGEDGVKSVSATAYFWVIPVKWTLITLAILAAFIALIVLMVKSYIRRMLALAGVDVTRRESQERGDTSRYTDERDRRIPYRKVAEPLRSGVLDLRTQLRDVDEAKDIIATVLHFVSVYRYFFLSLVGLTIIVATIALYIGSATRDNERYEVTVTENGTTTTLYGGE